VASPSTRPKAKRKPSEDELEAKIAKFIAMSRANARMKRATPIQVRGSRPRTPSVKNPVVAATKPILEPKSV